LFGYSIRCRRATAGVRLRGLLAFTAGAPEPAGCSSAWIQVASVAKSNGPQIAEVGSEECGALEFTELLAEIVWRIRLFLATIAERT
jgi:hypothetical protein